MKRVEKINRRDMLKALGMVPFSGMLLSKSGDLRTGNENRANSEITTVEPQKNQAWQLIQACRTGHLRTVKTILSGGFPVDVFIDDESPQGVEPHYKKTFPLFEAVSFDHFEVVKELIHSGADVNMVRRCSYHQEPSLGFARSTQVMNLLIDSGANINFSYENEWPIFLHFIEGCRFDLFELLVARGLDINKPIVLGGGIVGAVCVFSYHEPLTKHFETIISAGYCISKALAEIENKIASIQLNIGNANSEEGELMNTQMATIENYKKMINGAKCSSGFYECKCPAAALQYSPDFYRVKFQ